jgi:hypothetical protein
MGEVFHQIVDIQTALTRHECIISVNMCANSNSDKLV